MSKKSYIILATVVLTLVIGGFISSAVASKTVYDAEPQIMPYYIQPIFLPPVYQGYEDVYEEDGIGGVSHITSDVEMSGTLSVTGATTLTGAVSLTGALTVGTDLTVTLGDFTMSDGIVSITSDAASSTDTTLLTLIDTDSSGLIMEDGWQSTILTQWMEDDSGTATSSFEILTIMDDTASTSIEFSTQFLQKLDDGYTLSVVAEFDSGDFLFNTDDMILDRDGDFTFAPTGGDVFVTGTLSAYRVSTTSAYDDTLTAADSGQINFLKTTGATTTLPAVSTVGQIFTFSVQAAFDTANYSIVSAEGDNINGSLFVNDAIVACSGEDKIEFVYDGEQIGDFVELISDGTNWNILNSRGETASKLLCTDPS